MNLTLDALDAFVVFSEALNFTRAAELLKISQRALHVKIKKLGTELGVPLRLVTADRTQTLELLVHGRVHFGVTVLETIPEELKSELLVSVPATLVVPSNHILAKKKELTIEDLDGADLIMPTADRPHRAAISRTLASRGIQWRVAMEASGWELAIHFVKLGVGLAVVNGCCATPKGVTSIPINDFPATKYYLISKRRRKLSAAQHLLKELIVSKVGKT